MDEHMETVVRTLLGRLTDSLVRELTSSGGGVDLSELEVTGETENGLEFFVGIRVPE